MHIFVVNCTLYLPGVGFHAREFADAAVSPSSCSVQLRVPYVESFGYAANTTRLSMLLTSGAFPSLLVQEVS